MTCTLQLLFKAYLIEEMVKKLDAYEHGSRVCKLIRDNLKESLRAENIVLRPTFTPLGFERRMS